jgi:poly-beta-1,6 N-acetyl-D-glucosamine synthase
MRATYLRYSAIVLVLLVVIVALSVLLYQQVADMEMPRSGGFVQGSMLLLFGFLVLLIIRYFSLLWFSYLNLLDEDDTGLSSDCPFVSILVPAYNEGAVIQGSIRSLMMLDYPAYEVIVIDDGSSDDTYRKAQAFEGVHGQCEVRVIHKLNAGKALALNTGIDAARGSLVLCMDGDSALEPSTLRMAVRHFGDPNVGAVAGSVKVVNRSNILSALQALEYIEGLNMVRQAQAFFRVVSIIPGPIGVFRRDALLRIGGYEHDTFAEDCDTTLRLLIEGWQIKYEPKSIAYTEAPEKLLDLLKQRYRWTRGILQALRKHRRILFDPRRSITTSLALWYMVFEGIMWPVVNVFANVLFVAMATTFGATTPLVIWWAQLTVLDMAAALYCVAVEEERIWLVPYAIYYRLFFALTIDVTKVFATIEEIANLRMDWGKLDRIGRI